jgi:sarcosine oxidase subunit alpha
MLASTMPAVEANTTPILADQFVVAGGWQPDLSLWLGAGGSARWSLESNAMVADGRLTGMMLAGAAAGYRSLSGCARSGVAAVAALFKRRTLPVRDVEIDSFYETPNGPTGMAPASAATGAAYLDHGWSLLRRSEAETHSLASAPRALGLGYIAACVQLGLLPAAAAGMVAGERANPPIVIGNGQAPPPPAAPKEQIPAYMAGRFGEGAELWTIAVDEARRLRAGALLYASTENADPATAVGAVVVSSGKDMALALVAAAYAQPDARFTLRDGTQRVATRLVEKRG